MINVGTTMKLVRKEKNFANRKEEIENAVYEATISYQTTMATLMVQEGFRE